MMELILLMILAIMMARRGRSPRKRAMGRYIRGPIQRSVALGTLAAATGIRDAGLDAVTERTLLSSIVVRWALQGLTKADNAGPIQVGVAHSDYSLVEIEEYLELSTGWAEGDKVSQEIAKRQIRRIGTFEESGTLNDGKAIKTKLNWILNAGQTCAIFAYNQGGAALATTDPDVVLSGHANLWPR